MRLGVSAKIFLAYAVLLAAFAGSTVFILSSLRRGRQEMEANQRRREIEAAVERASLTLQTTADRDRGGAGIVGRAALQGLPIVRDELTQARTTIDEALADDQDEGRRVEFQSYRRQVMELEALLQSKPGLELVPPMLSFAARLRETNHTRAKELLRDEKHAVDQAVLVGAGGLLAALAAALFMWRTLRPLQVLRVHARQIAGGDYGRRIGVTSRDEIGDLAREFDAMARAIEEREQRLIRSERLATVGRMAAQITHEIRNPLASIGLYVDLLADELPSGAEEARRIASSIGTEVDRLSEITETYLRFVRLPRPKLEREDLGAIATAVMEFSRGELSLAGIDLELRVAAGLPEVAADENQIRQALLNLVRNAKEAMPSGGRLRVEVAGGGAGQVRLSITDTGPGIAPEHLGKIFDPFFSTKEKGTGLGLALVHQIVTEHGGRIEVAAAPGGGTIFALAFPALPRDARPSGDAAASASADPTSAAVDPDKLH